MDAQLGQHSPYDGPVKAVPRQDGHFTGEESDSKKSLQNHGI